MEYALLRRPISTDDREWLNLIDEQQTSTQGYKDNLVYIYICIHKLIKADEAFHIHVFIYIYICIHKLIEADETFHIHDYSDEEKV